MWYLGLSGGRTRLLYATSSDGVSWARQGLSLGVQAPPYNFDSIGRSSVMKDGATYKLWFSGGFWTGGRTGGSWAQCYYAESSDGISWTIVGTALAIDALDTWDDTSVHSPEVVRDVNGRYWMYYQGWDGISGGWNQRIGLATSSDGRTFTRIGVDPVLVLGPTGSWDSRMQYWVSVVPGAPWQMWYSGSDGSVTVIGRASAADPYNWTKSGSNPEFVTGPPGSWEDVAVQGPRILRDGGETYMYYTGLDGSSYRIGRARMTPGYVASGTFLSQVLDAGGDGSVWSTLSAIATVPAGTGVLMTTRSGDVPTPDASWSAWSAASPPGTVPIASPRARYLQVRAAFSTSDPASTPVLHEFSVTYEPNGAAAPVPVSPAGGAWVNTSTPLLSWVYADPEGDPAAGFRAQVSRDPTFAVVDVDSSIVLSATDSWMTTPLSDGTWYWHVQTLDAYGSWSPFSSGASLRVDTTAPTVAHSFSVTPQGADFSPGLWVPPGTSVSVNAADAGSGIAAEYLSIDGVTSLYVSPVPLSVHGAHTLEFWSVDNAGNAGPAGRVEILVDLPPSFTIVAPSDGTWLNRLPVLAWTIEDPDGDSSTGFEVQVAGDPSFAALAAWSGVVSSSEQSWNVPSLPDATYYWRLRVRDALGVWASLGPVSSFRIDTVLPTVWADFSAPPRVIELPPWMSVAPGTVFTLTAADTGSGVREIHLTADGVPGVYSGPVTLTGHGVHSLEFWAIDVAGNTAPAQWLAILVDREPGATNRAPIDQEWTTGATRLSWDFADPDQDAQGAFEVQIASDAGFVAIVASSGNVSSGDIGWQAPTLADGAYLWRVRVRDAYGVWSSWSPATAFRVDATPPEVSATRGGAQLGGVANLYVGEGFELTASDQGSGVDRIEYSIDGGSWTEYTGAVAFDGAGRFAVAFRAVDVAGNMATTQVLFVIVGYPANWTPAVAAILAIIIAVAGVAVARRRTPVGKSKAVSWLLLAGPAIVVEAIVGTYSLVTGELGMPPWMGAALVALIAVLVGGMISLVAGSLWMAPPAHEEPR